MAENSESNQENQGWGGARPGSGRPKGSSNKPRLSDYITIDEVKELVEKAKAIAHEKPEVLKFLLEQVFGKARQNIGLDNGEGDGLKIIFDSVFNTKLGDFTRQTENSSSQSREI